MYYHMKQRLTFLLSPVILLSALSLSACGGGGGDSTSSDQDVSLTTEQQLGKKLFFDENLSSNSNQSCADCHDPASGFADPLVTKDAPVSEGSKAGEFGNRNAPTSSYAAFIPDFGLSTTPSVETISKYQGGQFIDGRALDLVEQAKGPFLNPVEMNNGEGIDGKTNVVNKVQAASYADEFTTVYGANAFTDVESAYHNIATAIAAFEKSAEMSPFSSKFDAFRSGKVALTDSEFRGMQLFMDGKAKCVNCHTLVRPPRTASNSESLFTDFKYFNIGVPVNPANPSTDIDIGLAGNENIDAGDKETEKGKFRTPTLRNIELTAPYMHNGIYATLEEVIRHYDITVANYIADPSFVSAISPDDVPEVTSNLAEEVLITLGLDNDDTDGNGKNDYTDLINFMLTLTDGYTL